MTGLGGVALPLASLIAACLPAPLPRATDVRILWKLPLTGGIIFCGLLIRIRRSGFCKAVSGRAQCLKPHR